MHGTLKQTVPAGDFPGGEPGVFTDIMVRETRLLEDLSSSLTDQRTAVARNDPEGLNRHTARVAEVMGSIRDIRSDRRQWMGSVLEDREASLGDVVKKLGSPPAMADARRRLLGAAQDAVIQLEINRTVLKHAAATGDAFLSALVSSLDGGGYAPSSPVATRPAVLVNRIA